MTDHDATTLVREHDDLVAKAEADPHRPRFHFVAPGGWLNDPNGLAQRDGTFHLFYQYNPHAPVHGRIHWGHATSTDLVHWSDAPVALVPGPDGPDADGCWSGVLVDDDGTPTIVYSGRNGERELPCLAVGSPDLRTWTQVADNPVITDLPEGVDVVAFRDHCVWREQGSWRQLVGGGIRGQGGTAFLYESPDLRTWSYLGPLLVGDANDTPAGDPLWTGTMWECVDLFRLTHADGRPGTSPPGGAAPGADVLVFSAWHDGVTHHPLYWTGSYRDDALVPAGLERLDYGGRYFYAPQSFADESGRRVMFGWIQEGRTDAAACRAGWSGVMSLPRTVALADDGTLAQRPATEVAMLRGPGTSLPSTRLSAGNRLQVPIRGDQLDLELDLELEHGRDSAAEIVVRLSGPDGGPGAERTSIVIARTSAGEATVLLDRSLSSLDRSTDASSRQGEVPVAGDDVVSLRVLVDHSVIEVFVNGRALAARVYPTRPDALGVELAASHGEVLVRRAEAWPMSDAWDGPRPLWPR